MSILAEIVAHKQKETEARMRRTPTAEIKRLAAAAPPPRPFAAVLAAGDRLPVIAEMKRRSPSKGVLCADYHPAEIAAAYARGRAACLSVLTDAHFFGGDTEHLKTAAAVCSLPILRKDFILNEWQIFEARAMGADAILLIAAILSPEQLRGLAATAIKTGMAVLVETHDADEVATALTAPAEALIGINNRDLKTFHTDVQTTLDLLPRIKQQQPQRVVVAESGIHTPADVSRLQAAGADAFLIGEALVSAPEAGLRKLFGDGGERRSYSSKNIQL